MKLKALALAVAAVATLPGAALAISPTTPGIHRIFIAGSTSVDRGLALYLRDHACIPGSADGLNFNPLTWSYPHTGPLPPAPTPPQSMGYCL